jgi:hypothetical protein
MEYKSKISQKLKSNEVEYKKYISEAFEIIKNSEIEYNKKNYQLPKQDLLFANDNAKKFRWFLYPNEGNKILV